MKNNLIATIFLALFLVSTTVNAVVIFKYNSSLHQLRQLQANLAVIPVIQQLYNESVEYGKSHPDMARYLQMPATGAPKAGAPVSAPAPAAKPNK